MSMSRKHYEEIALILGSSNITHNDIERLADYFKMDNPRFDKQRFTQAVFKNRVISMEIKRKLA
tara:strand:- start:439 stop:630 length:192 start_codon:yes stop_codon:yes gene_type:complete